MVFYVLTSGKVIFFLVCKVPLYLFDFIIGFDFEVHQLFTKRFKEWLIPIVELDLEFFDLIFCLICELLAELLHLLRKVAE